MNEFFIKLRRAQNEDDYESWGTANIAATLNGFDNTGSVRATTLIIFYGNRVDDVRFQKKVINTLQARMGTGGNNMPMVFIEEDEMKEESMISFDTQFGSNATTFENISPTLKASQQPPSFLKNNVRRLTPMECERLQGFPDGWTDGQADSSRYKQMGNAVAVPVVDWIIGRLVNEHMKP